MKRIAITDIDNIRIGQTEDKKAATGCTVLVCPAGMRAGLDIRGGGPASRETALLDPLACAQTIHAVVLGGGSAFGLDAAGGVMALLEERGIGLEVGITKVPLVVQSDIFDLTVGDGSVRPDKAMGYAAAKAALDAPNYRDGNFGAGCGASVGKSCGMEHCMKTGIGSCAVQIGDLKIGAVTVLNALGDVFDSKSAKKIAGMLNADNSGFADSLEFMTQHITPVQNKFADNTTISAVMTNAKFDKAQLCKIAGMAHDGYARSISPVHTSADGDSIYALSAGDIEADIDAVGVIAAEVISEAIKVAVYSAESAYGLYSAKDLPFYSNPS